MWMSQETGKLELVPPPLPGIAQTDVESTIVHIGKQSVILDSDLARFYGVETKRLNEQVKRNAAKFGEGYVFQLTKDQFAALRSQSATSKSGRGGRRYPPWVFTEHGVVMAATVLDSDQAIQASRFIVEVFVAVRRRVSRDASTAIMLAPDGDRDAPPLVKLAASGQGFAARLQQALDHVLDSVVDKERETTVREEAQHLIAESIQHLKDRLKKQGLENEEIAARVVKLLAEAEKEKAVAAKTRAEAGQLEFALIVRKLQLLLAAQRAVEHSGVDGFLDVLRGMDGND
jgi:hypothetical protein